MKTNKLKMHPTGVPTFKKLPHHRTHKYRKAREISAEVKGDGLACAVVIQVLAVCYLQKYILYYTNSQIYSWLTAAQAMWYIFLWIPYLNTINQIPEEKKIT